LDYAEEREDVEMERMESVLDVRLDVGVVVK
jgi:hypothetical protein